MTKAATIFLFFCGFGMLAVWGALLGAGQVPELATAPLRAGFLLAAEFATAAGLLAAGYGVLRRRPWAAAVALPALGMLLYCAIYSIGVFGQEGVAPAAAFFGAVATLAFAFVVHFVRREAAE